MTNVQKNSQSCSSFGLGAVLDTLIFFVKFCLLGTGQWVKKLPWPMKNMKKMLSCHGYFFKFSSSFRLQEGTNVILILLPVTMTI